MTGGAAQEGRLPVVVTLALLTELVTNVACARAFGDGPLVGRAPFATFAGCLFVALALLWIGGSGGSGWRRESGRGARSGVPAWTSRWLPLLPAVALAVSVFLRGVLGPGPLRVCGLAAAAGAFAMVLTTFPARLPAWTRSAITLAAAIAGGLALRFFELTVVPLDPSRGDMLPLVILAGRKVLAGNPPYAVYHFPWAVPLTYLPLGWLAYAPLSLASIDTRWTSSLAELAVLGALFFASRRAEQRPIRDVGVVLWATWFVSSRLIAYDAYCAAAPQWAVLAWLAVLVIERHRAAPVLLGIALATTLLTVPLLPFVVIGWSRERHPARSVLVAALVAAVLVVPWFAWSPGEFVFGVVGWFNDLDAFPRAKWTENAAWAGQPGLAGLFWTLHVERLLKPLQLLALAVLAWSYVRARRSSSLDSLPRMLVAAMILFLTFNPVIWIYMWETVVVLALVALATDRGPSSPSSSSSAWRRSSSRSSSS